MLFIDLFKFLKSDKEPLKLFLKKKPLNLFQSNYKLKFRIPWDCDYVIQK